jgi:hypothetical protein
MTTLLVSGGLLVDELSVVWRDGAASVEPGFGRLVDA